MYVIVTGGSKGIGKSIVKAFAAIGAKISLCARNANDLYNTVSELQTAYPKAIINAMQADLSKEQAIEEFAVFCYKYGTPDILVNNAGRFIAGKIINEADGLLKEMIETNLYSAYHLTRKLLPEMLKQKKGHIFNICSIASLKAYPNGGSYSISKYALKGFSDNLREELKSYNIKVTGVYPGAVETASWGNFDNSQNRIMDPDDIAAMIVQISQLGTAACVEDIVIRPQLGDL